MVKQASGSLKYSHTPVLLQEVMDFIRPLKGGVYIDATLGGGGYSASILERLGGDGHLLALDADINAVNNFKSQLADRRTSLRLQGEVKIVQGNFRDIEQIAKAYNLDQVDGIVADLGLSSFELDDSGRGFSFQKPQEPLDMRFDQSADLTAMQVLNTYSEKALSDVFFLFGEERHAKAIAKSVVKARKRTSLALVGDLVEAVRLGLSPSARRKWQDTARRIFQSVRIEVNGELVALESFLPQAFSLLKAQGRLAVVSFHSLEDRIVKNFFTSTSAVCKCPPKLPVCVCGQKPVAKILTKKPITPSLEEIARNSRSASAKLRVLEKI